MSKWTAWPGNASVEYQIDHDLLRIRRWVSGQPDISEWSPCGVSAETAINHHLSLMR